jgi:16S rRNA (guanine527-N7)-methyltransferase
MTLETIAELLAPYTAGSETADWPRIHAQLLLYLDLILKWNARVNLTAIRDPEEIVRRHFGESLFAGAHLGRCATLLDYGSGAGFPGVPIQLLRPDVQVTLAESRAKKAAFLLEVVRTLGLSTEIWPHRVEAMAVNRTFDTVALRAVDEMPAAIAAAAARSTHNVLILGMLDASIPADFTLEASIPLPESHDAALIIATRR